MNSPTRNRNLDLSCLRASPELSDIRAVEAQRRDPPDIDLGYFLKAFADERMERASNVTRWQKSEDQRAPSAIEDYERVFQPHLTQHVYIPPDALRHIKLRHTISYPQLDTVAELICSAVAARLSRRLDAYKFVNDSATETLEVPDCGSLTVEIDNTRGVYYFIREIRGANFSIRNNRDSGRIYCDEWVDCSRPGEISVIPLNTRVQVYSDDSGTFVIRSGAVYSSGRARSDQDRLTLDTHAYNTTNPTVLKIKELTEWHRKHPGEKEIAGMLRAAGIVDALNFSEVSLSVAEWLRDKVLLPLSAMPRRKNQITDKPTLQPYPASLGVLHTWLEEDDALRLIHSSGDPSKLRPDERVAVRPNLRLIPLGERGDFPEEAHEGFVWCGVGEVAKNAKSEDIKNPELRRSIWNRSFLAEVRPTNGERMWVIDSSLWETEGGFAVAKSMVPVGEYAGNYKTPLVMIARDLELDEVVVANTIHDPNKRRNWD